MNKVVNEAIDIIPVSFIQKTLQSILYLWTFWIVTLIVIVENVHSITDSILMGEHLHIWP